MAEKFEKLKWVGNQIWKIPKGIGNGIAFLVPESLKKNTSEKTNTSMSNDITVSPPQSKLQPINMCVISSSYFVSQ